MFDGDFCPVLGGLGAGDGDLLSKADLLTGEPDLEPELVREGGGEREAGSLFTLGF